MDVSGNRSADLGLSPDMQRRVMREELRTERAEMAEDLTDPTSAEARGLSLDADGKVASAVAYSLSGYCELVHRAAGCVVRHRQ